MSFFDYFRPRKSGLRRKATMQDLKELKETLMATQAELAAELREFRVIVGKIKTETTNSLDRIVKLEAAIENQDETVSQEVLDEMAELKAQLKATDDLVADAIPPVPEGTPPTP